MLAVRAPAVCALAVRVRAVRFRAGRVVCLCSVRLHRAALVDVADTASTLRHKKGVYSRVRVPSRLMVRYFKVCESMGGYYGSDPLSKRCRERVCGGREALHTPPGEGTN